MGLGVDGGPRDPAADLSGQRVEKGDFLDLVVEQLHPYGLALRLGGKDIDDIPRTR